MLHSKDEMVAKQGKTTYFRDLLKLTRVIGSAYWNSKDSVALFVIDRTSSDT
jgi:hypothetical protein